MHVSFVHCFVNLLHVPSPARRGQGSGILGEELRNSPIQASVYTHKSATTPCRESAVFVSLGWSLVPHTHSAYVTAMVPGIVTRVPSVSLNFLLPGAAHSELHACLAYISMQSRFPTRKVHQHDIRWQR